MPTNIPQPVDVVINPPNTPVTVSSVQINAPLIVQSVNITSFITSVRLDIALIKAKITENAQAFLEFKDSIIGGLTEIKTVGPGFTNRSPSSDPYQITINDKFIRIYSDSNANNGQVTVVKIPYSRENAIPIGKRLIIKNSYASAASVTGNAYVSMNVGSSIEGSTSNILLESQHGLEIIHIGNNAWERIVTA